MALLFAYFVLGFLLGGISIIIYGLYSYKRRYKEFSDLLNQTKPILPPLPHLKEKTSMVNPSIKSRLTKAQEITEQQLNILYSMEAPQTNSLDGRNKNRMNQELKRLEEEKQLVLKSIVDDGYNPRVAIVNADGELEKIYLKDYLAQKSMVKAGATKADVPKKATLTLIKDKPEQKE
jgi:hypothetical protein